MARISRTLAAAALAGSMGMATEPASAQRPDVAAAPTFTAYTKKPELTNQAVVAERLREAYPPLLQEAGVGGTAIFWFFIERTGGVGRVQLFRSSGYDDLDEAAAKVARTMEFTAAENRGRPVDVWVQIPISFTTEAGAARQREREQGARERSRVEAERLPPPPEQKARSRAGIQAEPTFTPYTVKPELRNAGAVARALQAAYPPLLRDAGIGGTTIVWFLIDEEGDVLKRQVERSSGHGALDEAALAVAGSMRFHPAMNRDEPVLVWVQIPVTFSSK